MSNFDDVQEAFNRRVASTQMQQRIEKLEAENKTLRSMVADMIAKLAELKGETDGDDA